MQYVYTNVVFLCGSYICPYGCGTGMRLLHRLVFATPWSLTPCMLMCCRLLFPFVLRVYGAKQLLAVQLLNASSNSGLLVFSSLIETPTLHMVYYA